MDHEMVTGVMMEKTETGQWTEQTTDRRSNLDGAIERCDKAAALVQDAWDSLRERIDLIVQPSIPTVMEDDALIAVREPESRLKANLTAHAVRLESLAASIRDVTSRLDT